MHWQMLFSTKTLADNLYEKDAAYVQRVIISPQSMVFLTHALPGIWLADFSRYSAPVSFRNQASQHFADR